MYNHGVYIEVLMVRTQIYLTQHEREGLAKLTKTTGMKLSELIRKAVNRLIDQSSVRQQGGRAEKRGRNMEKPG
jgi:hypothetical protein